MTQIEGLITYETTMKPPYFLTVTYPIAVVMVRIHSLAVAMRAPRSMVLVVCDSSSPFQAEALARLLQVF
jgi:hypothetical protein